MATRSKENLLCPVCHEIFKKPVILTCGHSFCSACLQRWWRQKTTPECPLCKRRSEQWDPPRNLALKNLCEDLSRDKKRVKRLSTSSASLCSLHSEKLKLFCLEDQQLLCVICLHSERHIGHTVRPIDEIGQDYREILRELLKPAQQKLDAFKDIKGNFDQAAKDIEVQGQDTERQIKDVFSMLSKFLKEEEEARLRAVRQEKMQKIQTMRERSEALSRDIAALSNHVRDTEEALRAKDLSFLQRYKSAAEGALRSLPDDLLPVSEGLIDMEKHLNNLSIEVLENIKEKVDLQPTAVIPAMSIDRLTEAVRPNIWQSTQDVMLGYQWKEEEEEDDFEDNLFH